MLNLIRKDILILRYYFLFVVLYIAFFGFLLPTERSSLLLGILPTVMLTMFSCSLERKNKNLLFVGSLPISRKQIVSAKYSTLFVYLLIGLASGLLMMLINRYVLQREASFTGTDIGLTLGICFLFGSLFFPIYYWLGAKGSQIVIFIFVFLTIAASNLPKREIDWLPESQLATAWLFPVVGLLLLGLSFRLSLAIFRRKDMAT
ncbi:ABC-2 transporter permease [Paenibacillus eucommiae]|uniref:ABC-type transport system involved in multi-copper enzyme maturation permease subunit n=1 Tax=Paenibacillus eucommiae TaxID=1355755 RepID=A0ABS4IVJ2_9BACL|nr:ABC-2 transporter permease [Paenibacillus eucommiae]MBP1991105.1 ABC-type transport system involved in multi-copper enzyme maturation permease subunit [Paenibacillus eucommiae]